MRTRSDMQKAERNEFFAELKAEYLYIAIPFILLISVKLYTSTWIEIVLAPDWSLVSCIIFGQITSKISRAIADSENKASASQFGWYTAKRFLLVVIALACYFGMLAKPTLLLGCIQILVFVVASLLHFTDGFTAKILLKRKAELRKL